MDTAQWPQEIVVKPIEEIIVPNSNSSIPSTSKPSNNNSNGGGSTNNPSLERRVLVRPTKDQAQALNCPRCNSTNTKFCYYNNYSLTQPRYFCKTCRRYWTEGGSLRNIPVGGGSRKNKRSSSSSSSSSTSSKMINGGKPPPPPLVVPPPPPGHLQVVPPALPAVLQMASLTTSHHHTQGQNPNNYHHRSLHHHHLQHGQDLNLGFPTSDNDFKTISELIQVPNFDGEDGNNRDHVVKNTNSNSPASTTTTSTVTTGINTGTTLSAHQQLSALELLTRGSGGGLMNSFMPMPIHPDPNAGTGAGVFSSSGLIPVPEFKLPSLSFSLDGIGNNGSYGGSLHHQENGSNGGRLLFPFEDLKHVTTSSTTTASHDHDHGGINDGDDQNRDPNGDSGGYWNGMLGGASW